MRDCPDCASKDAQIARLKQMNRNQAETIEALRKANDAYLQEMKDRVRD